MVREKVSRKLSNFKMTCLKKEANSRRAAHILKITENQIFPLPQIYTRVPLASLVKEEGVKKSLY